jgi:hypothetical protein
MDYNDLPVPPDEDYANWKDGQLQNFVLQHPSHKHLQAVVAEIDRRRQERLDRENQQRDATNAERHQVAVGLAEESIVVGKAAQKTNVWVLRVSIVASVLVFVFGVSQCLDNRSSRGVARPAPTKSPQQTLTPAPSSQPTAQPAISPTTPP